MKDVEKVSDDLYIVKQHMRPRGFCRIIIVFGTETIGLIDSGFENTPVRAETKYRK